MSPSRQARAGPTGPQVQRGRTRTWRRPASPTGRRRFRRCAGLTYEQGWGGAAAAGALELEGRRWRTRVGLDVDPLGWR